MAVGSDEPFHLTFYNVSDDPKCLTKRLNNVIRKEVGGMFREPFDIENPVFLVADEKQSTDEEYVLYNKCNYIKCLELNRFYFITKMELMYENVLRLTCEEDYLQSWHSYLEPLKCVVVRNEKNIGSLMPDHSYPIRGDKKISAERWGTINKGDYKYYITTNGGNV